MEDEILNVDITNQEKQNLLHVIGESRPNIFNGLWNDLEWDKSPQKTIRHLSSFSERFEGLDAEFDKVDMTLSITQESLDGLNRLLVFANYNMIKITSLRNDSGLDFSIKKL